MSPRPGIFQRPFLLLLAVTVVTGLFVSRDFGVTWDEPLFYRYADALGYAYTPANWFSGHFDLSQSYGPSGDDHKNRGPAYLLLARGPVYLLQWLGVGEYTAWHFVNFVTFLLGMYFVYRLALRLSSPWPAATAAALFAFQPMLWGHAFINPKDMPFLVFFAGAVWLGFRMADGLVERQPGGGWRSLRAVILPGILLGLATGNRVLGPLAGLLVLAYLLGRRAGGRALLWMLPYAAIALLVVLATWPYLWEGPTRFVEAFTFMSANPTVLPVLFADQVYRAYDLPRRYLPFFMFYTLSEPVWPLAAAGVILGAASSLRDRRRLLEIGLLLCWLLLPAAYVIWRRPPMYDGMRHFLFILPPVFVLCAPVFDTFFRAARLPIMKLVLAAIVLIPGILAIRGLHPYEYTYYNAFIGGTAGAFRHYETDYWLTCYKQAVEEFDRQARGPVKLYVHREAEVAEPYAAHNVTILDERGNRPQMTLGDFLLVNTRTNEDRQVLRDAPVLLSVGRAGATFCVIKSVP